MSDQPDTAVQMRNDFTFDAPAEPSNGAKLKVVVQAELAAETKNFTIAQSGMKRSGAQFFGYAYIAGRSLNRIADLLAHGQLRAYIAEKFPDVTSRSTDYYRQFARDVEAKVSVEDTKHKPLLLSAKTLSKKEQDVVAKIVPDVMEGQTMTGFMRAMKFMREETEAGGVRHNDEELQAWLQKNFPKWAGKSFDELPTNIQGKANAALMSKPRKPSAVDQAKAADEVTRDRAQWLRGWAADKKQLGLAKGKTLRDLEEARLELGRTIAAILKNRKETK